MSSLDKLAMRVNKRERLLRKLCLSPSARRRLSLRLSRVGETRQIQAHIADLLQHYLGESIAQARRLAEDWIYYRARTRVSWMTAGSRSPACTVVDAQQLQRYFDTTRRGVVIAAIHMGDYLEGLAGLGPCLQGRRVKIIRRKSESAREREAFEKFARSGINFDVIRHGRSAVAESLKGLRKGEVVVGLYDLPSRWGQVQQIEFFSHPAWMVSGPARLAVAADADILPMVTCFDERGDLKLHTHTVIDTRSFAGSSKQKSQKILQRLSDIAECAIRANPAQWNHWHLMPEICAPASPETLPDRADG